MYNPNLGCTPVHARFLTVLLFSILLVACGGGGSSNDTPAPGVNERSLDSPEDVPNDPGIESPEPEPVPATIELGAYHRDAIYPKIKVKYLEYVPTTSGNLIGVRVTLPANEDGTPAEGPFPTILVQSAYNISMISFMPMPGGVLLGAPDPYMVRRGYAQVSVDVIGGGVSEGGWEMLGAEEQSGYGDAVDWIKQQPWSNGDIGVAGASYMAITGLFTAQQRPDDIKAVFASVPMGDAQRGTVGIGGMLNATFMSKWMTLTHLTSTQNIPAMIQFPKLMDQISKSTADHIAQIDNYYLPIIDATINGDPEVTYDGEFWRTRSPIEKMDQIQAPTFFMGALNDIFQRDAPLLYETLKDRVDSRLVIYNGDHVSHFLQAFPGTDKVDPILHLMLQWFDQYLMGMDAQVDSIPPVTQYVRNYQFGMWQGFATTTDWPHPAAMPERWYLRGDMGLSRQMPEMPEPSHEMATPPFADYEYRKNEQGGLLILNVFLNDGTECSPSFVQWTLGSAGIATPKVCFWDRDKLERFALNYESEPMAEDYYINGPIQADIWMESTKTEAVLAVRIDEVTQSGRVIPITDGMLLASARTVDPLRSRYLNGEMIQPYHYFTQAAETFLIPGEPTLMQVEIFPTSALIRKGNKLRVSISPSNQAQGMLNEPRRELAQDGITTIHNSPQYPSSVVLPIVPLSELN
ncbi:MAG: CocE/NonD family hydrolase [Ketobacter sp.]|nr:MAG: CocE/NonD family hydrolase [Ketobacter sp.]